MLKVYLVICDIMYEGSDVCSVWSDGDKAQAEADRLQADAHYADYRVQEWVVQS